MIPDRVTIEALHDKYAPNDLVKERVWVHCQIVCEIALWCVPKSQQPVNQAILGAAALLHDIGMYCFYDEAGTVPVYRLYRWHPMIGAKLVADEGLDARIVAAIETHMLLGLTRQEILDRQFLLPPKDYVPHSAEARILGYADRFHSKQPVFNDYQNFLNNLRADLPLQAEKFAAAAEEFGIPDVTALAQKYHQSVR